MKSALFYSLILLMPTSSALGSGVTPVLASLKQESQAHRVPYRLLYGICKQESMLNPRAFNKYDGGTPSRGLCQLKVATARAMGFTGTPRELFNLGVNTHYAAKLLKYQMDRYHGDWIAAVSAYNAGHASKHNKHYIKQVFGYATMAGGN
jgi:soluble lytic murein transglycosylase-like protein